MGLYKPRTIKGHLFKTGVGQNIALWVSSKPRTLKGNLFKIGVGQNNSFMGFL